MRVIFRAVRGSGYRSDIAIDQVSLRDALPVGISTNEIQNTFRFSPNPVTDVLQINSPKTARIQVLNMLGSIVEELNIRKGMNQINATTWTPGVYFIRLSDGVQSETQKFIKQ